ncbi:MAG: hypothetical protein HZC37_27430 [Burkholderiales bacterium]|nr:hypothetical protein [Burkholderiales bacterium]
MTTTVTNELIYETLKRMQGDLTELRRETREVKADVTSIRSILGDLIKTDARRDGAYAVLEQRIERIERRLDLHDPRN